MCGAGRTVVFSGSSFILSYWNPVLFYFWKWHSLPFPHMCSDCPSLGSFCPSNKNKDFHSSIKSISRIILCKVEGLQLHSSSLSSMFRRHSHYFYLLLKTFRSEKKNLYQGWQRAGDAEMNICLPIGWFTKNETSMLPKQISGWVFFQIFQLVKF